MTTSPTPGAASGSTTSGATGTQSLDRAMAIVAMVVEADEPMSFNTVARESDLPKSTASRLLSALERTQLLERNSDGGYVAGPIFWLYATRHDPWEELVRIARPTLEKVGAETRETVHLGVARNGLVAHIDQVDSDYLLGTRDWTDLVVPSHSSALGKVLMAHHTLPTPLPPLEVAGPRAHRDVRSLERELAKVRKQGYAEAVDELEEGLTAIAVPVSGIDGQVFGAIGVSGPTSRMQERIEGIAHLLITQSGALSTQLRRRTRKEGVS